MNNICVFDFETDHNDPTICSPVQLGAVIIDSKKLSIINNSEFNGYMKPPNINDESYIEDHKDTLKWHADLNNLSIKEIIEKWQTYPDQKTTWQLFVDYVQKYNTDQSKRTIFSAPNPGGHNILAFDMIIIERLCQKYGPQKNNRQNLFFTRDIRDSLYLSSYWLDSVKEVTSYSLDNLRNYFGMSKNKSHDAIFDCKQAAELIIKYIRLARYYAPNIKFKDAFKNT